MEAQEEPIQPTPGTEGSSPPGTVVVRALAEDDLPEAQRLVRLAFGTFLGAPAPENFWSDRDYVRGRWRAPHVAAFAAEAGGKLAGSNFATRWGSVGFFGPLTIRPDLWDRGVGQRLVEAATARFDAWGVRHAGLFTFADSPKHMALYQRFGYAARFLTAVMSAPVRADAAAPGRWSRYSALPEGRTAEVLGACRDLTDALYEGLDLRDEIEAVRAQGLGETVLLRGDGPDGDTLAAFAVCHHGPRSEAGAGACLVKFGAVRPGPRAEQGFASLLDACGALAAEVGMPRLLAGVNMARHEAYRHMVARGFRTEVQGVTMHRPNEPGYSRPGVFVLDDWR